MTKTSSNRQVSKTDLKPPQRHLPPILRIAKNTKMQGADIVLLVLAVFCPPLSAVFKRGLSTTFLLNILLTLLGYLPGLIHAWYLVFKYPIQQYHMLPFGIGEGRFNRESSSIDLEVGIPDSPGSQSSMLTSAETPGSLQSAKRSSSFASGRNSSDKKKSSAKSGRKSQAKDRRKSSVSASTSRWDRFTSILDFPDPTQQPPPGDYDDYRETINQAAIASAKLKANGKNKKSHKKRNSHKKKKSPNDDTTASLLSSRSIEQMEIHSDNSASSNGKKSHDNDNTPLL